MAWIYVQTLAVRGCGVGGSLSWAYGHDGVFGEARARGSLEHVGGNNPLGAKVCFGRQVVVQGVPDRRPGSD